MQLRSVVCAPSLPTPSSIDTPAMDIGLAIALRNLPGRPSDLPQLYQDFLTEVELAEELGFSHAWISEHHFAEDDWNSAPLPLLAAAAARTQRIRLGTYVLLLALHDPLRVAEDAVAVDLLSRGRLDLAIGAGPMEVECKVFGIDKAETFARTYEALAFMQRLFDEEAPFTHEGKYYQYRDVCLRPKPVQRPNPPIWMAAMGPQSIAKAAERGYHLASALHSPLWKTYPELLAKAGRRREDQRIVSGPLIVHLAPTQQQAWDEAEVGAHWCVDFYRRRGWDMPLPPVGELRRTPGAGIYGIPFHIGTPDEVLRGLERYRDDPLDQICLQFRAPGMDLATVRRSMQLFAREVMPEMRRWGSAKTPA
jgi:alkanesulfonate monooxygenase SsuD/methylene tetrahydromethanopterin reductase-like flavin-dependent oxidoreductase (luciferase family)